MRVALFSLDFGLLLLLAVVALLHTQGTTGLPNNGCPSNNCASAEKCELPVFGGVCKKRGDVCCSILIAEHRTECRHHGGECMDGCNDALTREAKDCPANQRCCVLV